jgi:hypothetical protein
VLASVLASGGAGQGRVAICQTGRSLPLPNDGFTHVATVMFCGAEASFEKHPSAMYVQIVVERQQSGQ